MTTSANTAAIVHAVIRTHRGCGRGDSSSAFQSQRSGSFGSISSGPSGPTGVGTLARLRRRSDRQIWRAICLPDVVVMELGLR
jgi:hypothetical protein